MSDLTREDDPRIALGEAVKLYTPERFDVMAGHTPEGELAAVRRVTAVADEIIKWMRRPVAIVIGPWQVREMDTLAVVTEPVGGSNMTTTLDSSQEGFAPIEAKDDRGWVTKTDLDVTVEPEGVVEVEIVETPAGQPDELVVRAVGAGSALVTASVPGTEVPAASEAFDVVPGGVASITFGGGFQVREQAPVTPEEPV